MTDQAKIRNRLFLSTWPLLGDDGNPVGQRGGPLDIGVLDLVRVAAIRHQAIETLQTLPNGQIVRRTYVGKITAGLAGVCPGINLDSPAFQAVRLGAPDATGMRDAIIAKRSLDSQTYFPEMMPKPCMSEGNVTIEAVRDGPVTVPATSITQILLPVKLN